MVIVRFVRRISISKADFFLIIITPGLCIVCPNVVARI